MSTTEDRSSDTGRTVTAGTVDKKLEVVVIPVSDAERAKEFYGWLYQEITTRLPGRVDAAGTELPK